MAATSQSIPSEEIYGVFHRSKLHQFNLACLMSMYSEKMLCDIVLVAQGLELYAHKLVLASCSTFFYFKFSEDRKLCHLNRIEIENISFETLTAIINYLYTSEIYISEKNIDDLIAAAHMLILKDLQIACHNFLKANIKPSNCLQYRNIANDFQCNELLPKLDNYIGVHFSKIMNHQEFLGLPYDQLIRIICSDELSTKEENVLECVFKWVRHDLESRRHLIYPLMKVIRFSLIPQQDVLQRFEGEHWLKSDPQYNSFLGEIFKCYFLTGNTASVAQPRQLLESRQSSKLLVVIGVIVGNMHLNMEMYDLQQNIWIRWPEAVRMKCEHMEPRVTIIGSYAYCIDGSKFMFSHIHNPAEMTWVHCSSMVGITECYHMTNDGSKIYAIGYSEGSKSIQTEMCDISRGHEWKTLPPILEPVSLVGLGCLNENLYVVGGERNTFCNTIQTYKLHTNSWYLMPNMSIKRRQSGVAAIKNTLYVVGGRNHEGACNHVEAFNYDQCCWSRMANMNVARSAPGVIPLNGQLYVVGGYNFPSGCLDSVEVYDPQSNTWTMLENSMATGKRNVAVAIIDKSEIITKSTK